MAALDCPRQINLAPRAMMAAIASGVSHLTTIQPARIAAATLSCLEKLGVRIGAAYFRYF